MASYINCVVRRNGRNLCYVTSLYNAGKNVLESVDLLVNIFVLL